MNDYMFWVKLINSRGHAGSEAKTNVTRRKVEQSILENWRISLSGSLGLNVTEVEMSDHEPPDAFTNIEGHKVAVELTELVDGNLLAELRSAANKTGVRVTSSHGPFFKKAQWTKERFLDAAARCVNKKQSTYANSGIFIDYLVISTAENWLSPRQVEEWLKDWAPPNAPNLRNIHFLMGYEPGRKCGYPLFVLK